MKHNFVIMDSGMIISSIPLSEFHFLLISSFTNFSFFLFFVLLWFCFTKSKQTSEQTKNPKKIQQKEYKSGKWKFAEDSRGHLTNF